MARIRAQERLASAAAAAAAAEAAASTSTAGNARSPLASADAADAANFPVNGALGRSAAASAPDGDAQPAPTAKVKRRLAGKKAKRAAAEAGQTAAVSASVEDAVAPKPRKRRKDREPAADAAVPAPDSDRSTSEQAPVARAWWGASRFVSCGCLTGLQREEAAPAAQRVEFSESTQVHVRTHLPRDPCAHPVLDV